MKFLQTYNPILQAFVSGGNFALALALAVDGKPCALNVALGVAFLIMSVLSQKGAFSDREWRVLYQQSADQADRAIKGWKEALALTPKPPES